MPPWSCFYDPYQNPYWIVLLEELDLLLTLLDELELERLERLLEDVLLKLLDVLSELELVEALLALDTLDRLELLLDERLEADDSEL